MKKYFNEYSQNYCKLSNYCKKFYCELHSLNIFNKIIAKPTLKTYYFFLTQIEVIIF